MNEKNREIVINLSNIIFSCLGIVLIFLAGLRFVTDSEYVLIPFGIGSLLILTIRAVPKEKNKDDI